MLHVQAADHGRFVHVLPVLARQHGIRLFEVAPADESLESVFAYLVGRPGVADERRPSRCSPSGRLLGRRRGLVAGGAPGGPRCCSRSSCGSPWTRAAARTPPPHILGVLGLATVIPLLGLIAGTGAIGGEIDDGSIVYLLAKPVSRHSIVVTKLAVAAALVSALGALPVLVAGWILVGSEDNLAVGYALGALVAGHRLLRRLPPARRGDPQRGGHRPDLRAGVGDRRSAASCPAPRP